MYVSLLKAKFYIKKKKSPVLGARVSISGGSETECLRLSSDVTERGR